MYRVSRELRSLVAALGGIDALVFTAGIGQHAPPVRARVCEQAGWLGIRLDPAATGTGNTLNANEAVVRRLIVDSLRYWVGHMHVDGFRASPSRCGTSAAR